MSAPPIELPRPRVRISCNAERPAAGMLSPRQPLAFSSLPAWGRVAAGGPDQVPGQGRVTPGQDNGNMNAAMMWRGLSDTMVGMAAAISAAQAGAWVQHGASESRFTKWLHFRPPSSRRLVSAGLFAHAVLARAACLRLPVDETRHVSSHRARIHSWLTTSVDALLPREP